jgi:hypothetical protein
MREDRIDPLPFRDPRGKGAERAKQKGAQRHAEGQHGPVARARFLEQLRSGETREAGGEDHGHAAEGRHRLFEEREQRDHAEQQSEKNRIDRDIREHGHNRENFQVRGGSASSRAAPRNPTNPREPDAPTPGEPQPPAPQRVPGVGAS